MHQIAVDQLVQGRTELVGLGAEHGRQQCRGEPGAEHGGGADCLLSGGTEAVHP